MSASGRFAEGRPRLVGVGYPSAMDTEPNKNESRSRFWQRHREGGMRKRRQVAGGVNWPSRQLSKQSSMFGRTLLAGLG